MWQRCSNILDAKSVECLVVNSRDYKVGGILGIQSIMWCTIAPPLNMLYDTTIKFSSFHKMLWNGFSFFLLLLFPLFLHRKDVGSTKKTYRAKHSEHFNEISF